MRSSALARVLVVLPLFLAAACGKGGLDDTTTPDAVPVEEGASESSGEDASELVGRACATTALSCGPHGTCAVVNSAATCLCSAGYKGTTCNECAAGFHIAQGLCVADTTCLANTCSGRGICSDAEGSVACACASGTTGRNCEHYADGAFTRKLMVPGMADPDIFKESDDLYYLSGTTNGRELPILESKDLETFTLKRVYQPGVKAPGYTWCDVWAPDLFKREGRYYLYFSSRRTPAGGNCGASPGTDVATFFAVANDSMLDFGPPQAINETTTAARTFTAAGCPAQGCNRAIRIDSALYDDGQGTPWLFYVWFSGGNNLSAFRLLTPSTILPVAGPANFAGLSAEEEGINEGPEVFSRNGKLYLFFSGAWYNSQYAMFYVSANSVPELNRNRVVRRNSIAVRNSAGRLVESHGHNSITTRHGEFFNFIHQGEFNAAGAFTGRSVHKQRMGFKANGDIESLNQVTLRWSNVPGHVYSLDVIKRDGTKVGPCVSAGVLGSGLAYTYSGICPSGANQLVHKGDVKAFRIYYANNGVFTKYAEVAYDGHSDDVFVPLAGGTTTLVNVGWNEKETGATYSLDVQRKDTRAWVGPCLNSALIKKSLSRDYLGRCTSAANVAIAPSNISRFRVCSAVNENWAAAKCGETVYDGVQTKVEVLIP
ncbi:MAG: family 43 glycosylhydrolase [Myxococcaceae bacterium]